MIFRELESAGNMSDNLQMLGASMDKANSIDDTPTMDIDGKELTPADASISFGDVSFSYGERKILDHISLSVPGGTTTAVVGPSGGGKTTLCNLIARFWDVQDGSICIGGHDVRDYKLDSLMKNISMVFQSVYLFNDTIENNIKFGRPDAIHDQVVEAAKRACCHDFISQLPDGYDTVLSEGGGSLSGGEKQRTAVARALINHPLLILADEPTGNLDSKSTRAVIRSFEQAKQALEATIFMVTHDSYAASFCDRVVILRDGVVWKVLEKGSTERETFQDQLLDAVREMGRE